MTKNLVIVESPAKAKTIEKFLGSDYKIVASMGHIRDLPPKSLGVNMEDFSAEYEVSDGKKKVVTELKKLAKLAEEVYIATDEDREGEAIGWHICNILGLDISKTKRIAFHEITKSAVTESVKNPRKINSDLVDAQQARRILDRLVGYKVSPILWKKIKKGLSAGRVQSVAVKMIVERENEIKNFKPVESWKFVSNLAKNKNKFQITLNKIGDKKANFKNISDVEKFYKSLENSSSEEKEDKNGNKILEISGDFDFKLLEITKKDGKKSPSAPFITSTLQQEASRKLSFSAKQTMSVAQKLYEGIDLNGSRQGLITYMRTDSLNLSKEFIGAAAGFVKNKFGENYSQTRNYKTKSAGAQEAHEAIRPVDINLTPEKVSAFLNPGELRLYTLIWKRALASQMSDAKIESTIFDFELEKSNSFWQTSGEVIKFDGFMTLYIESKDDEESEDDSKNGENGNLPELEKGETLNTKTIFSNQNFSKPPARYTEASLVKKLETEGIGRPSTYAPTISTIIDRGYVEKFDKKYLIPTDISFLVVDYLNKFFVEMMDYSFTKNIEEDFDKIANGKENYKSMLQNFWQKTLEKDLKEAEKSKEKVVELTGEKCPECSNDLVYKYSKTGKFIGCSNYPECKYTDRLQGDKDILEELRAKYEGKPCPEGVAGTIVVKIGRFGPFLASSEYPEVKWIGKIKDENEEVLEEILKEKGLLVDEETGEELVVKKSRRGPFLAAKNYPAVKIAKPIPKDILAEVKERMKKD